MCLPEMPHMMLLLICDLLQLKSNEMMLKKSKLVSEPLLQYQALLVVSPILEIPSLK